ncbi:MAG: hypothetical protein ACP5MU_05930 [Thermoplasmata archaeon]
MTAVRICPGLWAEMITVNILGENKKRDFTGKKKGIDIIRELGLSIDSTIIIKDGKPLPEDEIIEDGSSITIIKSFSGG